MDAHQGTRRRGRPAIIAASVLLIVVAAAGPWPARLAAYGPAITGPYASLLAASANLGPSQATDAQLTVALLGDSRPAPLIDWAQSRGLTVRWRDGDDCAIVAGPAPRLAEAFAVPIHDYRGRGGQTFYASPRQPDVPAAVRTVATGVGRILSYLPHRTARPVLPRDVPRPGLGPRHLLTA